MDSAEELARTAAAHLVGAKYFQLAAFVMQVYDHAITFGDEVERIWSRKLTVVTVLFLLNRYGTLLEFIVVLFGFHNPNWKNTDSSQACQHFVTFEGAGTIGLVAICELIMILRVYALYGRSLKVLFGLLFLGLAQVMLSGIGIASGFAVPLPPELSGCILTGQSILFPALWVTPLITDLFIFGLTAWKARIYVKASGRTPTVTLFFRDGIIYFFVIFMANLMNVLVYFLSSAEDLKALGASFSQLITSTMVSRLVLNLRVVLSTSVATNNAISNDERNPHASYPTTVIPNWASGNRDLELEDIRRREDEGFKYWGAISP